jgi:hypothetical protein
MDSPRMDRPLRTIVVLGPLALLGACLQVAPRSSVPFHASADRQIRYAAEISLAVKEDRRGEISEAAANGRVVLPQLPEIWAVPGAAPDPGRRALEADSGRLVPAASDPGPIGCGAPGDAGPAECRHRAWGRTLILPPSGYASIVPAAAPALP